MNATNRRGRRVEESMFFIGFLNVKMRKRKKKGVLCSLLMSLFEVFDFILKIKDLE